ncbi:MAG: hypothetical protein HZB39_16265 [Planctomycetes bacterium]|nr:hypothetical protein [Planctomycetota bacterium]
MIKFHLQPSVTQLAQFGVFSLFGFPAIGVLASLKFGGPPWLMYGLIGLGVLSFVLSRIDPKLVKPVFVGLMVIATPIGFVISMTLMILIFYALFLPVGLVFRAFGRDPIAKRPDHRAKSYWHERGMPRPLASYLRLY